MNERPDTTLGSRLRCITFDLDDTLWPILPAIQRAEARFYAWLQQHAPVITSRYTPETLVAERMAFMRAAPTGERHDLTRLRQRWLRHLGAQVGVCGELLANEGFQVFWEARNEVDPFPEAESTLALLARHYRLGTISNGNADVFRTPVGRYFSFTVPAAEAGAAKPDPGIFALAIARAGCTPTEILHVGDDPICDVEGARQAGLHAAWFNPQLRDWHEAQTYTPRPPLTLGRLGQLPAVLGLLGDTTASGE